MIPPTWLKVGAVVMVDGDAREYVVMKIRVSSRRFGGGLGVDLQRAEPPLLKYPKTADVALLRWRKS